jgi:hypothetical protein
VTKSQLARFSLVGIAKHVLAHAEDFDLQAAKVKSSFKSRVLPLVAKFPQLQVFPYPVQKLLAPEISAAISKHEDGEEPRVFEAEDSQENSRAPVCDCRFFQKWQLPCCHIWQHHLYFGSLTESAMETWKWMWEDGGYELYETRVTQWEAHRVKDEIGAPLRKRLDLGEVLTSFRTRFYAMEESVRTLESSAAERVMDWWLGRLHEVLGSLGDDGLEAFKASVGLDSGSDSNGRAVGAGRDSDRRLTDTGSEVLE